jgi:hypothetical protein
MASFDPVMAEEEEEVAPWTERQIIEAVLSGDYRTSERGGINWDDIGHASSMPSSRNAKKTEPTAPVAKAPDAKKTDAPAEGADALGPQADGGLNARAMAELNDEAPPPPDDDGAYEMERKTEIPISIPGVVDVMPDAEDWERYNPQPWIDPRRAPSLKALKRPPEIIRDVRRIGAGPNVRKPVGPASRASAGPALPSGIAATSWREDVPTIPGKAAAVPLKPREIETEHASPVMAAKPEASKEPDEMRPVMDEVAMPEQTDVVMQMSKVRRIHEFPAPGKADAIRRSGGRRKADAVKPTPEKDEMATRADTVRPAPETDGIAPMLKSADANLASVSAPEETHAVKPARKMDEVVPKTDAVKPSPAKAGSVRPTPKIDEVAAPAPKETDVMKSAARRGDAVESASSRRRTPVDVVATTGQRAFGPQAGMAVQDGMRELGDSLFSREIESRAEHDSRRGKGHARIVVDPRETTDVAPASANETGSMAQPAPAAGDGAFRRAGSGDAAQLEKAPVDWHKDVPPSGGAALTPGGMAMDPRRFPGIERVEQRFALRCDPGIAPRREKISGPRANKHEGVQAREYTKEEILDLVHRGEWECQDYTIEKGGKQTFKIGPTQVALVFHHPAAVILGGEWLNVDGGEVLLLAELSIEIEGHVGRAVRVTRCWRKEE